MDTCLNWRSEELQKLAEQVGVQATPAFADKVGVLMEQLGLDKNTTVSEEDADKINDDIDKLNNRIISLESQLNLYEAGSEQYNVINVDLNKSKSELSELENKLNQSQLPQLQSMKTVYGSNVSIRDASDPYKKTDPSENPDIAFVFTENAQAYAATTPSMRGGDKLLSTASPETVKINVSDMAGTKTPNTAGIRSIDGKTKQQNVFGIVVKKYQQLNGINSKFVAKEGQFNDTDSDFMLFQAFNKDFFEKLQLSKKKEIIMPGSIALGRSALPLRFAEWLQKEINNRLGVNYSIAKTETAGYDGYGLKFNSEINIESQLPTPQQVKDYLEKNKPIKPVTTTIKPEVSELFESNPKLANAVYEALGLRQESGLSEKNIFTVEPIQSVDKKAKAKAKIATQYIGFAEGIIGSSTALYAQQAGKVANTGNYSSSDAIFVSVGGKRGNETVRKAQQDKTIKEAIKALEAGATLITDNAAYVESNSYNEGEKRLAANLKAKGYNYSETIVDGNVLGVWNRGINQITPQQKQEAQQLYSQYLKQGGSQEDIQGFKNFVKKQPKEFTSKHLAYAEVLLPAWSAKFFGEEFRTQDNTIDFDKLNEMLGERGLEGLGYRIPTEDKYSLLPIRIVGFLPESGGGAVMLPAEITTISGSDFDVDKLYTLLKSFRQVVNNKGETEFKVIEYLDDTNSTVEERWKIMSGTKPKVRAIRDKYNPLIEAAQKTLDRSIKIQRDKLNKLKAEKKSQEQEIDAITEDIDVTKLERELAFDMLEMPTTELNNRKDELATPEELQGLYDNIEANKTRVKEANESLTSLYQKRAELSNTKIRKEDVDERYAKKDEAFKKYLEDKHKLISEMYEEINKIFPIEDFKRLSIEEQNTRKARDNRKLEIILATMRHRDTTLAVLSPGGYDYLKNTVMKSIIDNRGNVKKASNIFSLNDVDAMTLQNLAGKALVGIAANHNKHHTLRQWSNLKLTSPVLFDGKEYSNLNGKDADTNDGSKRTITRNLAEILAAVVDNAKDPVANILNYNEHTADLISLLIASGADINTVFAFVNQPAFIEAMDLLNTRKEKRLDVALRKVAEAHNIKLPTSKKDIKARNLNLKALQENMGKSAASFQNDVIISALDYLNKSKDLGLLIRASKADTAGIGQRVEEGVYLQSQVIKASNDIKTISGTKEFLEEASRFTKMFTEYGVNEPMKILEEMFPYSKPEFVDIKSAIEASIPGELSAEERQLINRAYIQYKMNDFGFYKYVNRAAVVKYTPSLLLQVKEKYPELTESNYLIRYLQVNYTNADAGMALIEFANSLTSSEEQINKVKQSWKEMFDSSARERLINFIETKAPEKTKAVLKEVSDDYTNLIKVWNSRDLFKSEEAAKVLRDYTLNYLAESLIRYSFFTTGHEFTPTAIKQLIPVDVYMNLKDASGMTIGQYSNMLLEQASNENPITDWNFVEQFIRHRASDSRYVARVETDKSNISNHDIKTDTIAVGFDKLNVNNSLVETSTEGELIPKQMIIAIKSGKDYKLYQHDSTLSDNNRVIFKRVEALGISNRTEYSTDPIEKSLYKKNNIIPLAPPPAQAPSLVLPSNPIKDPEGIATNKEADDKMNECITETIKI